MTTNLSLHYFNHRHTHTTQSLPYIFDSSLHIVHEAHPPQGVPYVAPEYHNGVAYVSGDGPLQGDDICDLLVFDLSLLSPNCRRCPVGYVPVAHESDSFALLWHFKPRKSSKQNVQEEMEREREESDHFASSEMPPTC